MTVPSRVSALSGLIGQLKNGDEDSRVFVDGTRAGHLLNALGAWRWIGEDALGGILLEDDVILSDGFYKNAMAAINARPDEIISFFGIQPALRNAYNEGYTWAYSRTNAWNQAIYMPSSQIWRVIKHLENMSTLAKYWDVVVSVYALMNNKRIYYTLPCLVEHFQGSSELGHAQMMFGRPRVAGVYLQTPGARDFTDMRAKDIGGQRLANYRKDIR